MLWMDGKERARAKTMPGLLRPVKCIQHENLPYIYYQHDIFHTRALV